MSTRVQIITNHLSSRFPNPEKDGSLDEWRKKGEFLNKDIIRRHYLGKYHDYIVQVRSYMEKSNLFDHSIDQYLNREQIRDKVLQQVSDVTKAFPLDYETNKAHPSLKTEFLWCLAEYDLAVCTRSIVHISLYTDTITNYGTEKHRKYIDRAYKLQDIGCFSMTELGHGSNVSEVETTATYDVKTHSFIINSPTRTSTKWWIGGAAKTANMSVVFAQLITDGVNNGVHAFLVPIRNNDNSLIPQVVIGDCGPKISIDGVDNGFLIFKQYSVPYDCLLDKLSQVTPEGKFKSHIKNKEKRLGIVIGGLFRGRTCVSIGSVLQLAQSVGIAIRYSALRKQFSPNNGPEVPILSYQQQKFRLIPLLAQCLAAKAGCMEVQRIYDSKCELFSNDPECEDLAEFHCILSGVKAISSWYAISGIQVCRECCGGLGYSSFSALGRLRNNQEIHCTWEGDNSVLIQQTSKYILKQIQRTMKGQKIFSATLQFLKFQSEPSNIKLNLSQNLDHEELKDALQHLINHIVHSSIGKLQENAGKTESVTDAWNKTQTFHLADLSRIYTEYLLSNELHKMALGISKECEKTGKVFLQIGKLYTLGLIEKNLGSLLELGYDVSICKRVRDTIIHLCEEIGEVSVNVVDAILPSDKIIGSAIGASDGQAYKRMIDSVENAPEVYDPPYWLPVLKRIRGVN